MCACLIMMSECGSVTEDVKDTVEPLPCQQQLGAQVCRVGGMVWGHSVHPTQADQGSQGRGGPSTPSHSPLSP